MGVNRERTVHLPQPSAASWRRLRLCAHKRRRILEAARTAKGRATVSTQTEATPIEPHCAHSERLMQHAFDELAKGDRIQASEKAWGAMAHTLKAIADERGLTYEQHSQVRGILRVILADVADPTRRSLIRGGFTTAADLHRNFYDDVHLIEDIDQYLEDVQTAIGLLNQEHSLWRERNAASR